MMAVSQLPSRTWEVGQTLRQMQLPLAVPYPGPSWWLGHHPPK
jgi:hypothetical protein